MIPLVLYKPIDGNVKLEKMNSDEVTKERGWKGKEKRFIAQQNRLINGSLFAFQVNKI